MKCPNCGCQDFKETTLFNASLDAWSSIDSCVTAFACANCGRIELYANDSQTVKDYKAVQRKTHNDAIMVQIGAKKAELDVFASRLDVVEKTIADENRSVKDVREAKELVSKLKRHIEYLKSEIKRLEQSTWKEPESENEKPHCLVY